MTDDGCVPRLAWKNGTVRCTATVLDLYPQLILVIEKDRGFAAVNGDDRWSVIVFGQRLPDTFESRHFAQSRAEHVATSVLNSAVKRMCGSRDR